jgi:hypothetical protein
MTAIDLPIVDQALAAADEIFERQQNDREVRPYLGMSGGGNCPRAQWYSWQWAVDSHISAKGCKAISDGFTSEDVAAARLQKVPDLLLQTVDHETGRQFALEDAGGHIRGHMDGVVFGLPVSKTPHVFEHKACNERKFKKFQKLKADVGEKATLRAWDEKYFVQAQLYMLHGGYKRHWTVVSLAGCRDWDSCRTEFSRDDAEFYANRMERIVENIDEMPERVSESPNAFACRWCDFIGVCHEGTAPKRQCRTCRFSKPVPGPDWRCSHHDELLTLDRQKSGCNSHRYRAAFIPGIPTSTENIDTTYRLANGQLWVDRGETDEPNREPV